MIDFQEAYSWLYHFDAVDSLLSESAKRFESPIQEALTKKVIANLDEPIAQILKIGQTSTKILEKGEICLLCARAYYAKAEIEIAKADIKIEEVETNIAEARLGKAKAKLETKKANKQKTKAELEKAKAEWVKADAELKKAEAEREKAKAELGKALDLLDEAGNLYKSDPHKYAVVQWLKGCTYWKFKNNQAEALQFWQRGLDTFERIKVQYRMDKQGIDWYQEQCEKMRQSIQQVNL